MGKTRKKDESHTGCLFESTYFKETVMADGISSHE